MTSTDTIRWGMETAYKRDQFATVKPSYWATTYNRPVSDIEAIMAEVVEHYATTPAPDVIDEHFGEGK